MNHLRAVAVKLVYVEAITLLVLRPLVGAGLPQAAAVGVAIAALSYFAGDLLILAHMNGLTAVTFDAVIAFLLTWAGHLYAGTPPIHWIAALIVACAVGIAECFYHNWVQQTVLRVR